MEAVQHFWTEQLTSKKIDSVYLLIIWRQNKNLFVNYLVKKNVAENNNMQKPLWCLGIHLMYHQKIHIVLKFVVLTGCFLSNAK